jgi:hypothetical protein
MFNGVTEVIDGMTVRVPRQIHSTITGGEEFDADLLYLLMLATSGLSPKAGSMFEANHTNQYQPDCPRLLGQSMRGLGTWQGWEL